MATWADVRRIVKSLPGTSEGVSHGNNSWNVQGKAFLWERPLRESDILALGDQAPTGEILAARVESLLVKESALRESTDYFFTTPHFDGYPAILVQLKRIPVNRLQDLLEQAWLSRAPKRMADEFRGGAPVTRAGTGTSKAGKRKSEKPSPTKISRPLKTK